MIVIIVFVNMGPNGSKKFKTLRIMKIADNVFKLVMNFPSNGPHKTMLGIL